jgi:O-Antigen ligase
MPPARKLSLQWFEIASAIIVALAVLLLPVTSQPTLARLMGHSLVAPPAILVIGLLGLFWLPVFFIKGGKVPAETRPFIAFVLAALISSLAAYFIKFPAYRNFTALDVEKDALLTFAIAVGVYFLFALWFRTPRHLKLAAILVNASGFILVAWCLTQLYVILGAGGEYPGWMVRIQFWASVRSLLDHTFLTRVGGFAYEPSWLAHQLNVLFIPFWFAATVTGYSSVRKLAGVSLENILLAGGVVAMIFSFSRVGLLALLLMSAYALWRLHVHSLSRLQKRFNWKMTFWMRVLVVAGMLLVYALIILGILKLMGHVDARFNRLFALQDIPLSLFELASKVDFAERVVYWANGFQTFARYPLLGVGLGNTGFFFAQHLPLIAKRLNEITYVLTYETYLPNVKSLWVRVMSETGLIGFSFFCTWLYLLWHAGKHLERQALKEFRLFGWMSFFVIMAFLAEGFSIDSFALPYLWVSLGLVTAASAVARKVTEL